MLKIARRIVPIPIAHMRPGRVHLHMNRSPAAIPFYFSAQVVRDQVVPAILLLNLWKRIAQVAQIEERFSAQSRALAEIFAAIGT